MIEGDLFFIKNSSTSVLVLHVAFNRLSSIHGYFVCRSCKISCNQASK